MTMVATASSPCPDDNRLLGYVEGGGSSADRAAIATHVEACSECAEVVEHARADLAESRGQSNEPQPGDRLGRYRLVARLGAGAMGTVFEAEDLALGRRVAVKVLRYTGAGTRSHFEREARCLATVSHPAIVGIHDVGEAGGHDFFAMELVRGCSLRDLLAVRRPPPARIVALFVAAGHGLAAAHDAGLVHRDFKPGNLIVTPAGAVKVVDFGLAKLAPELDRTAGADDQVGRETIAGLGTPAFMAPERRSGQPGDARSDQYSFCAALGHSLTGVYADDPGAAEAYASLPRRWRRVLRRGLEREPAERYPSMYALLDALASSRSRSRAALALGALVLAVGLVVGGRLAQADELCAGSAIDSIWNDDVRAAVDPEVAEVADAHARTWRTLDQARCRAEAAGHASPQAVSRCLDAQRSDLAAYLDVMTARGEGSSVADAWLGSAVRCEDPSAPEAPRPLERAERADALRDTLRVHETISSPDVWLLVGDPAGHSRLERRALPSLEVEHACRLRYDGSLWELARSGDRLWSIDRERNLRVTIDPSTCTIESTSPLPGDVRKNGRGFDVLPDGGAVVVLDGAELVQLDARGGEVARLRSFGALAPESLTVCADGTTFIAGHHDRTVGRTLFALPSDDAGPRRIGPIGEPIDIDTLACGPHRMLLGADTRGDVVTPLQVIDPETAARIELGSVLGGVNGISFSAAPSP